MLLHLGQNVITFRTLLHLGSFITFRPSTTTKASTFASVWTTATEHLASRTPPLQACKRKHRLVLWPSL